MQNNTLFDIEEHVSSCDLYIRSPEVMLRTQFLKDTEKSHTCTDRNKIINNYREDK